MMRRTIFASDLDNTLLFSQKHAVATDLCVELLNGAPQGYLTQDAPRYLEQIMQRALFVPVTSRSVEQYRRIQFPAACRPRYAVTTNGAILLVDGEIDQQWQQASLAAVLPWKDAFEEVLHMLREQPLAKRYRVVDEMFVFAACDTPQDAAELKRALEKRSPLKIEMTGRKLYFFPPQINKGAVIPKLREYFHADWVICAGDSAMDVPMLQQADVSIVPNQEMMNGVPCRNVVACTPSERFYDFTLKETIRHLDERALESRNSNACGALDF